MTNMILVPDKLALATERNIQPAVHHQPNGFSDRFALGF
ncbi:MAG: oxidase, partial [Hyphomicrobiales bacterium]